VTDVAALLEEGLSRVHRGSGRLAGQPDGRDAPEDSSPDDGFKRLFENQGKTPFVLDDAIPEDRTAIPIVPAGTTNGQGSETQAADLGR
jgi:hypothetical protein